MFSNSTANNFWRLSYGAVDVSAPLDEITVSDTEMRVRGFERASLTSLDLRLVFASDPSPGFRLPASTLPALANTDPMNPFDVKPSRFVFDTQGGFDLDAGSLYVNVQSARIEAMPPFQAVPELATYASVGARMLLGAAAWRGRSIGREGVLEERGPNAMTRQDCR